MGIEPTRPAWKAGILPLNYTRMGSVYVPMTNQRKLFYHNGLELVKRKNGSIILCNYMDEG